MKDKIIKAVIFDIDGVLLDSFEANLKFFQDLMIKFGYEPPTRENYPKVFHLTMLNAIKALTGSTDENEINKIWEAGKNRDIPYPTYLLKSPDDIKVVLKELSKYYQLGIVTSRLKGGIFVLPQMTILEKYFKVVISYDDTINHKPHPEPLLLAAKKLGVHPEQCIYIGDVENDVLAAKAVKMKVIIYSKNKIKGADYCTSSFKEIINLVERC